jgi:hypothetical protein
LVSLATALFLSAVGCGESSNNSGDAVAPLDRPAVVPDTRLAPDTTSVPDRPSTPDAAAASVDTPIASDGGSDVGSPGLDGPLGGAETGTSVDGSADTAPDGFSPGLATPIVVNSANTGVYSLADGTWKVFTFDATLGQIYCISELDGIVHGYVSSSPAVSPTNYEYATNADGNLAFRATNTPRLYIAVAASGGGVSGSFQVADGGQLLALGANTVTLAAPDSDNYTFFRFPISAGHSYNVSVTGTATSSVGIGLSPLAERASNGQFSAPLRGVSGPLPFNEAIPDTSVALSYSGYYYLFLRFSSAMTVTVTITQTS